MKKITLLILIYSTVFLSPVFSSKTVDSTLVIFTNQLALSLNTLTADYEADLFKLQKDLNIVNSNLAKSKKLSLEKYLNAINEKILLKEKQASLEDIYQLNIAKARYRKGLELIKLMYEKILGLDHHFHSVKTYNNIAQITNPNAYPTFQDSREDLKKRLKKDNNIRLPNLLYNNPIMSATFSLVASFIGEGEPKKKEKELEEVACIMDFTVRMFADLNLIYYETEFLKESNNNLKADCLKLFKEYAKIVDYKVDLHQCRADDDWETIYENLDKLIATMESDAANSGTDPVANRNLMKGVANLEFSIDRLLDFLEKYNSFIAQGGKYYQKFAVIASNYQNEATCISQLPQQFTTLKQDIQYSIDKFNEAYNITELNGSKLKDLLYGIEE